MKAGLTTSLVLHAGLLAFGLVSLAAPKPFEVVEDAIPVSTISETQLAQLVKGDKKAPVDETPAPKPTTRPDEVPEAKNVGDNSADLANAPTPDPRPREIEASAAPKAEPDPAPVPVPVPDPKPEPQVTPKPVPATELASKPAPREEVKPDPVKEAIQDAPAASETALKLPESAPLPTPRPTPPAQTAKAPDRKDSEKPAQQAKPSAQKSETASLDDQVKALINQEKASGGGQKRETRQAAAGNDRTNAPKLTRAEMDVLREQLGGCWSIDAGISDPDKLKVSVRFNLDENGKLDGVPEVTKSSGNSQFDRTAVRAIQKCDMRGLAVPPGKFETWREVIVNFDPADMFY
ncbi:hypothetical protein CSC94_16215 [Zhengella mangrovi]|uniref:Uncharacterized protein n=1 Tax=Zhengella mangrovi TaxID=1982044 RepID=A0A2G1QKY6_9HYPH|nr:cell envelope integrity protein TolA [Zhengella mangrovi]PHP66139.1 hypothetical protein CSC94_16215 [Zhengella mangrovi]